MNQVPKQPTSSEKKTAKALGVRVTKKTRSGSLKPKTQKELQRDIKKAKLGMATVKSLRGGARKSAEQKRKEYCAKKLSKPCKNGKRRIGPVTKKCAPARRCVSVMTKAQRKTRRNKTRRIKKKFEKMGRGALG